MADDVGDVISMLRVVLEHRCEKVFELLREEAFGLELLVSEPESRGSVVADELVEVILPIGPLHEGRTATYHDE